MAKWNAELRKADIAMVRNARVRAWPWVTSSTLVNRVSGMQPFARYPVFEEHYTDTAGLTDHVFALMHMLGFRFAPRIRDLGDTKLYIPGAISQP